MESVGSVNPESSSADASLIENIGKYTRQEYLQLSGEFHGCVSPGVLIGGIMVGMAQKEFAPEQLCDVICETQSCLPDAVQLLTPCTTGNGWMKIVNTGRFAVSFYDKQTGEGVRVYIDLKKLEKWDEMYAWFLKLKPKHDQNRDELQRQILAAGENILSVQRIQVNPEFMALSPKGAIAICGSCGEAYPKKDGAVCIACQEDVPFTIISKNCCC